MSFLVGEYYRYLSSTSPGYDRLVVQITAHDPDGVFFRHGIRVVVVMPNAKKAATPSALQAINMSRTFNDLASTNTRLPKLRLPESWTRVDPRDLVREGLLDASVLRSGASTATGTAVPTTTMSAATAASAAVTTNAGHPTGPGSRPLEEAVQLLSMQSNQWIQILPMYKDPEDDDKTTPYQFYNIKDMEKFRAKYPDYRIVRFNAVVEGQLHFVNIPFNDFCIPDPNDPEECDHVRYTFYLFNELKKLPARQQLDRMLRTLTPVELMQFVARFSKDHRQKIVSRDSPYPEGHIDLSIIVMTVLLRHVMCDTGTDYVQTCKDVIFSIVDIVQRQYGVSPLGCALARFCIESPYYQPKRPEDAILAYVVLSFALRDLFNIDDQHKAVPQFVHNIMCRPWDYIANHIPRPRSTANGEPIPICMLHGSNMYAYFLPHRTGAGFTGLIANGYEIVQLLNYYAGDEGSENNRLEYRQPQVIAAKETYDAFLCPKEIECEPASDIEPLVSKFQITHGFIASMIGPIRFRIGAEYYTFTFNPDDLMANPVILKSGETATADITEEERITGIRHAHTMYSNLPLRHVSPSMPKEFAGAYVSISDDEIRLVNTHERVPIEYDAAGRMFYNTTVPQFKCQILDDLLDTYNDDTEFMKKLFEVARVSTRIGHCGIYHRYVDVMEKFWESRYFKETFSRFQSRLNTYRTEIEFTSTFMSSSDNVVLWMLLVLEFMCPSMLSHSAGYGNIRFTINNAFLYWAEFLQPYIIECERVSTDATMRINEYMYNQVSPMFYYQENCCTSLVFSQKIMDILWLEVGAGKTRIVLEYIRRKCASGNGFQNVLWVGPASSFENIERQIIAFGYNVKRIDNAKATKPGDRAPLPGGITLLSSTMIKAFPLDQYSNYLSNSLIVLDELQIYYTPELGEFAISLIMSAKHTIGMTGTIYKNLHTPYIIARILGYCSDYPVVADNYLVALGAVTTAVVEKPSLVHTEFKLVQDNPAAAPNDVLMRAMLNGAIDIIKNKRLGVFLVVEKARDIEPMARLIEAAKIDYLVFDPKHKQPISVNDHQASDGRPGSLVGSTLVPILLTSSNHNSGYDANAYTVIIMPNLTTNNITITQQLRGRINRITNTAKYVYCYIYYLQSSSSDVLRLMQILGESDSLRGLAEGTNSGGSAQRLEDNILQWIELYQNITYKNLRDITKKSIADSIVQVQRHIEIMTTFVRANPDWPHKKQVIETIAKMTAAQVNPDAKRKKK